MSLYGCVYLCIRALTQALNMMRRKGSPETWAQSSADEQLTDGREQNVLGDQQGPTQRALRLGIQRHQHKITMKRSAQTRKALSSTGSLKRPEISQLPPLVIWGTTFFVFESGVTPQCPLPIG